MSVYSYIFKTRLVLAYRVMAYKWAIGEKECDCEH